MGVVGALIARPNHNHRRRMPTPPTPTSGANAVINPPGGERNLISILPLPQEANANFETDELDAMKDLGIGPGPDKTPSRLSGEFSPRSTTPLNGITHRC